MRPFQRYRTVGALLLALVITAPLTAASGGPGPFGYTWYDQDDGCPDQVEPYSDPTFFIAPAGPVGPVSLGFLMPFYGEAVTEVWIGRHGIVSFSDQGAAADSAVPQTMPDAAAPSHLVAPMWNANPTRRVTLQAFPDRFQVSWDWDGLSGLEPVQLVLFPDGDMRIAWGMVRPGMLNPTVGHEDEAGAVGTTYLRDGVPVEPGFQAPGPTSSLCIEAPALLDCSDPEPLACDDILSSDLPASLSPAADVYTCHPVPQLGNERVVRLDLDGPRQVTLGLDNASLDLFHVAGPPDCSEAACLAYGDQALVMPLLFGGSHYFVVDKPDAGGGDAFQLASACQALPALTCDGSATSDTTGGPDYLDTHDCAGPVLDGPERSWLLTLPSPGHLSAVLDTSVPDLWVVLYDASGTCLAAGRGGAAAYDLQAGDYVAVVDGEAAAAGSFDLNVTCGARIDCAGAREARCFQQVSGNTSTGGSDIDIYSCDDSVMDGPEEVLRFVNPREQLVSARFLSSSPGQRLHLLEGCDEGRCLQASPFGTCMSLPAGEHYLVVDGPAGSGGAFQIEITCGAGVAAGVDLAVAATDLSAVAADCASLDLGGTARVSVSNLGDTAAGAPFDVIVFEDRNGTGDWEGPGVDNLMGTAAVTVDLPAAAGTIADVPLSGAVLFRDSPLLVKVDPANAVPESDEDNNVAPAGELPVDCPPADRVLDMVIDWEWTGSPVLPAFTDLISTPVVADVSGDTVPDVVIVTQEFGCPGGSAVLRALSGLDGSEIWTADAPAERVACEASPALVDLTGDTLPETLVPAAGAPDTILAIDAGGNLLWTGDPVPMPPPMASGGAVNVGDVDGDTSPEIAWGANVLNADGSLFWTPESGGTQSGGFFGPISFFADLDGDAVPELVAGSTAYRWNSGTGSGDIYWRNFQVPDGFAAAANFDADPEPEIVVSADYTLYLLEPDTGSIIWETDLPYLGGGCPTAPRPRNGPPMVGDFDGDGEPEVGVAGGTWYVAVETDGTIKWQAPINDCSSGEMGGTLFDFDGDGSMEVAYMDQVAMRLFRGSDGTELATAPASSLTARELAVVADVDADGEAEIVLPAGEGIAGPIFRGVRVYRGDRDGWIGARAIWHQHAYHVTSINDNATLPGPALDPCDPPSLLSHDSFRVQQAVAPPPVPAPDITLALLDATGSEPVPCRPEVSLHARVGNAGTAAVGAFSVSFYDGDPAAGGALLGTEPVAGLAPGAYVDLQPTYPLPRFGAFDIQAVADDNGDGSGNVAECLEENNSCSAPVDVPPPASPQEPADLRISRTPGGLDIQAAWRDQGPGAGYRMYAGALGDWYSHGDIGLCDLVSPSVTLPRQPGNHYYLPVGTICGVEPESSYGRSSDGAERPDAGSASGDPCP